MPGTVGLNIATETYQMVTTSSNIDKATVWAIMPQAPLLERESNSLRPIRTVMIWMIVIHDPAPSRLAT